VSVLAPIIVILLLGVVAWFVTAPLRGDTAELERVETEGRRADLEAARDAKYREIRDLEMDHRTGKLSDEDWRVLDRDLRAEAVDILHELDQLGDAPATIAER
jgi:hypothetical protein